MSYRKKFIVEPGEKVRLDKIDPSYTGKHESHEKALPKIQKQVARMDKLNICFMRMASSLCWWCCKPWMPLAKLAWCGICSAA